jgi:hypothetical protein
MPNGETNGLAPITFIPINDQVVMATGRGVFVPGTGFVEVQVKVGDHVAVSTEGSWINLPLSEDKSEVFITVSESIILGKLEGATRDHRWFKKQDTDKALSKLARR